MNGQIFAIGVTVLSWAAVVYKGPATLRHRHGPAHSFWLTLLGIALGLTVLQQPAYGLLDHLLHRPNLARLLGDSLGLGAGWAVQAFLWQLNDADGRARRPIRVWGLALLGALAVMTVAFVRIPLAQEDVDFLTRHPTAPFVLGYRLAFLTYLGAALINVARLSRRYALGAARPAMRLGLRLVAAGALVGLLYVAHEVLWVLASRLGFSPLLSPSQTVPRLLMASGIGLMVLGSTLPSWGPRLGLDAPCRWLVAYRSLVRLYPLWHDLCLALPAIALVLPTAPLADRFSPRDVPFRLCRRVVEIRDGLLTLRAVVEIPTGGTRRPDAECHDRTTNTVTWEAVRRWPACWRHADRVGDLAAALAWATPAVADFAADVAALERLARWYRRPEASRLLLQWLADTGSPPAAGDRRKVS